MKINGHEVKEGDKISLDLSYPASIDFLRSAGIYLKLMEKCAKENGFYKVKAGTWKEEK